MSVAIVTWPVNDVGGINSWGKNFVIALGRLGVPNRTFYATPQTRFGCSETEELVKKRHSLLRAAHLSYHPDHLRKSLDTLNGFRLIVMLHPSPHQTKKNEGSPHARGWQHLYRETAPPKLVVFHDANWAKTNPWFADVAHRVNAAVAAQKLFLHSLAHYPSACPKTWEYFPLDLALAARLRKPPQARRGVVVATQWLKWKNHAKLLPHLPRVKVPVALYGNGQEYYELRKTGVFQVGVGRDLTTGEVFDPASPHRFHGFVPYESVLADMAGRVASLDLSVKGYTNMTHWEPLTTGTVSMVERRVALHPDNQIPPDCLYAYNLDDVAEEVNRVATRDNRATVAAADEFINVSCCVRVARRLLTWLRREGVVGGLLP